MVKQNRIGEVSYTKYGTPVTIKDYISCKKVLIEFQDDFRYSYWIEYKSFKNGEIKNPYDKELYNIAFVGYGKYKIRDDKGNLEKSYIAWNNMLKRCFSDDFKKNR